jgi:hypothetical protein
MIYPSYELSKEYQQVRLAEAEKERLINTLKRDRGIALRAKLCEDLGDLLVNGGLKLKNAAHYGGQL